MKRLIWLITFVLTIISCGPSRHAIHVEMRHPSRSGVELAGKIISVVYVSGDDELDNSISEHMSDAFSKALEDTYGTGEGSVGLYCVDRHNGDYSGRDSLVNLLMQTGSDVVFLMDVSASGDKTNAGQPFKVTLYCYDAMDKLDKVKQFAGTRILSASDRAQLLEESAKAGKLAAAPFEPQWKHEQYSIAYYDSAKWYEALVRADQYDWKGAMDIWIGLLGTNDMMKKASAEYDIAVACYMLGDFDLALQWLDRSDADNKLPTLSDGLRKRIEARKH